MTFEEYVAEHGRTLLRLACVLTGDPHRGEDLTQTVLADAYRHWRRVSGADHPHAYVRTMLVNAHLSWHRKRSSTERPTDLRLLEPGQVTDHADAIASRDQVRHLLTTLAPRARTVLVLRYYADLDDAAIAQAMGITPSAVRATSSRALTTLRTGATVGATKDTP